MAGLALYQIAAEYKQLVSTLLETQDDAQAVADTIEAEAWPLEVKAQQTAYAAKMLDAEADAIDAAIVEMQARAIAARKRADSIRDYIHRCMLSAGVNEIKCPHFKISIRKKPASTEIFQPELIPAEFMTQPEPPAPRPDKTRIKEAIKAGQEIPGVRLIEDATRLEIK